MTNAADNILICFRADKAKQTIHWNAKPYFLRKKIKNLYVKILLGALRHIHCKWAFQHKPLIVLLKPGYTLPPLTNIVDPDQLASEEANWSGSALFVNQYVNLYQQSVS